MKTYNYPPPQQWAEILSRPCGGDPKELAGLCETIFDDIRRRGDQAVRKYGRIFDGADPAALQVTEEEFARAEKAVPEELKQAIRTAAGNIEAFHRAQMPGSVEWSGFEGLRCRQEMRPIEKVGLYVPGGSAPLFSSVLMLAIPARLAGCREVVICTPPGRDGTIPPAILWTARLCGVGKVFKVGGIQAIAAMAVGTETIPRAYKLFGPGNRYVTAAKLHAAACGTPIDMPAGPSEVMVVADRSARPAFVAADLLSQAEHGPDSQVVLVTTVPELAGAVEAEVSRRLERLPRRDIAARALESSRIIVVRDREEALKMVNLYAPEHLILSVEDCEDFAAGVMNAGSVFLGNYTPESAGDYASGTNHTLPTAGWARAYSGVNIDAFMKKITLQRLTREGLRTLAPTITAMAEAELLAAHAQAVTIRLTEDGTE